MNYFPLVCRAASASRAAFRTSSSFLFNQSRHFVPAMPAFAGKYQVLFFHLASIIHHRHTGRLFASHTPDSSMQVFIFYYKAPTASRLKNNNQILCKNIMRRQQF